MCVQSSSTEMEYNWGSDVCRETQWGSCWQSIDPTMVLVLPDSGSVTWHSAVGQP